MNEPVIGWPLVVADCSISAWPMPWADAAVQLAGDDHRVDDGAEIVDARSSARCAITPVSGSISTSATWQPFGNVDGVVRAGVVDVERGGRAVRQLAVAQRAAPAP